MSIINLKTIIFGVKDFAQLAHWYLTHDSKYQPVAFCVHEAMMSELTFQGLPVVAFENIEQHYPKEEYNFFSPLSPVGMNGLRAEVYEQIKNKGYKFINYISSKATILTEDIGENNFILENNVIQPFVKVGNNCVFWSGNHIGHHSIINDHVMFTSHVVLSGHCLVGERCYFGVNSTVRDNLVLEGQTLVGQGANVVKNTEMHGVYLGNPAQKQAKFSYEVL